jgi:lysophospholipase L1-like esterase
MPLLRRSSLVTAVVVACSAAVAVAAPAGADPTLRYVALGDSFASVGTLTNLDPNPIDCFRAHDNYPAVAANRMGATEFVDATCGGAMTVHMTQSQQLPLGGVNPPQFDALTPDTDLVTVSISGNDIGFGDIVLTCGTLSLTDPLGAPCQAHYGSQLDERIAAAAGKVDAVLDGIAERAPEATVVVVGYLRILPPERGCFPIVPIAAGDVTYFDGVQHELNAMLGTSAAAHGATFVDPGDVLGHDVCQAPWDKWVEGIIPTSIAAPVHPNAAGQAYVGGLVADAVT